MNHLPTHKMRIKTVLASTNQPLHSHAHHNQNKPRSFMLTQTGYKLVPNFKD